MSALLKPVPCIEWRRARPPWSRWLNDLLDASRCAERSRVCLNDTASRATSRVTSRMWAWRTGDCPSSLSSWEARSLRAARCSERAGALLLRRSRWAPRASPRASPRGSPRMSPASQLYRFRPGAPERWEVGAAWRLFTAAAPAALKTALTSHEQLARRRLPLNECSGSCLVSVGLEGMPPASEPYPPPPPLTAVTQLLVAPSPLPP